MGHWLSGSGAMVEHWWGISWVVVRFRWYTGWVVGKHWWGNGWVVVGHWLGCNEIPVGYWLGCNEIPVGHWLGCNEIPVGYWLNSRKALVGHSMGHWVGWSMIPVGYWLSSSGILVGQLFLLPRFLPRVSWSARQLSSWPALECCRLPQGSEFPGSAVSEEFPKTCGDRSEYSRRASLKGLHSCKIQALLYPKSGHNILGNFSRCENISKIYRRCLVSNAPWHQ